MRTECEFGTTTTRETRKEAESYGEDVAKARGWRFIRAERYADGWTPVWSYDSDDGDDE